MARKGQCFGARVPGRGVSHMYVDNAAMQLVRAQAVRCHGNGQYVWRHFV